MHVFLTGATGYIGSAILPQLLGLGHDVTAIVRSAEKAAVVEAAGATAVVDDLADSPHLVYLMRESDAVVHTASPGDATSAELDRTVANAAIEALSGTAKPYVHTGGVWIYGNGSDITEDSPPNPPGITAWRLDVIADIDSADIASTIVHPGIVYGGSESIARILLDAPRTDDGRVLTVGSGLQHWTTIHVDDLAALYVAVLEDGRGQGAVLGVNGDNPAVGDLTHAIAGDLGVAHETDAETRARLGAPFADALLLDQQAFGQKARTICGWRPTRPRLAEVLAAAAG